jgi:hypothetical protein
MVGCVNTERQMPDVFTNMWNLMDWYPGSREKK